MSPAREKISFATSAIIDRFTGRFPFPFFIIKKNYESTPWAQDLNNRDRDKTSDRFLDYLETKKSQSWAHPWFVEVAVFANGLKHAKHQQNFRLIFG
jgi:hypothetical protein